MDGISASAFAVRSSIDTFKGFTLGQLVLGRDNIHQIKHIADWGLLRQKKHIEINYNIVWKKASRIDYN